MKFRYKQCTHCPWKKTTNPHRDIPRYKEDMHDALRSTIATEQVYETTRGLRLMACHESPPGDEVPCVGWLVNQATNNNIGLRLLLLRERNNIKEKFDTEGEQHENLEDTIK